MGGEGAPRGVPPQADRGPSAGERPFLGAGRGGLGAAGAEQWSAQGAWTSATAQEPGSPAVAGERYHGGNRGAGPLTHGRVTDWPQADARTVTTRSLSRCRLARRFLCSCSWAPLRLHAAGGGAGLEGPSGPHSHIRRQRWPGSPALSVRRARQASRTAVSGGARSEAAGPLQAWSGRLPDAVSMRSVGQSEPPGQTRFSRSRGMEATSGGQGWRSLTAKRRMDRARRTAAIFAGVLPHGLWASHLTPRSLSFHTCKVGILPGGFLH